MPRAPTRGLDRPTPPGRHRPLHLSPPQPIDPSPRFMRGPAPSPLRCPALACPPASECSPSGGAVAERLRGLAAALPPQAQRQHHPRDPQQTNPCRYPPIRTPVRYTYPYQATTKQRSRDPMTNALHSPATNQRTAGKLQTQSNASEHTRTCPSAFISSRFWSRNLHRTAKTKPKSSQTVHPNRTISCKTLGFLTIQPTRGIFSRRRDPAGPSDDLIGGRTNRASSNRSEQIRTRSPEEG